MAIKKFEQFFLRLTTGADRQVIAHSFGFAITRFVEIRQFLSRLVMRGFFAKNFLIAAGAFLALFLIYLIITFFGF